MAKFHPRDFRRGLRFNTLTDSEFRVAVELCEFAGPGNPEVWPSTARMAEYCCMDERSVRRIMRRLEAKGVVSCDGPSKGGRNQTNRWTLHAETRTEESGFIAGKPGQSGPGLDAETLTRESLNPDPPVPKPGPTGPETLTRGSGEVVRSREEVVRSAAARAIDACALCDDDGYTPTGQVCHHVEHSTPSARAAARAEVAAALSKAKAQ